MYLLLLVQGYKFIHDIHLGLFFFSNMYPQKKSEKKNSLLQMSRLDCVDNLHIWNIGTILEGARISI